MADVKAPSLQAGEGWRAKVSSSHLQASSRDNSPDRVRAAALSEVRTQDVKDFMGWDDSEVEVIPRPFMPEQSTALSPPRTAPPTTLAMRHRLLREIFHLVDSDCSRFLDTSELLALGASMGHTPRETEMLLQRMDRNRDGQVSVDEFIGGFTRSMPTDPHQFRAKSERMKAAAHAQNALRAARRSEPRVTCFELLFRPDCGSCCGLPVVWPGIYMVSGYLYTVVLMILAPCYTYMDSYAWWLWFLLLLALHVPLVLLTDHGSTLPVNLPLLPTWLLYCFDWFVLSYCVWGPLYVPGFVSSAKTVYPCLAVLFALLLMTFDPFPHQRSQPLAQPLAEEPSARRTQIPVPSKYGTLSSQV